MGQALKVQNRVRSGRLTRKRSGLKVFALGHWLFLGFMSFSWPRFRYDILYDRIFKTLVTFVFLLWFQGLFLLPEDNTIIKFDEIPKPRYIPSQVLFSIVDRWKTAHNEFFTWNLFYKFFYVLPFIINRIDFFPILVTKHVFGNLERYTVFP